jgi:hypothetical protein
MTVESIRGGFPLRFKAVSEDGSTRGITFKERLYRKKYIKDNDNDLAAGSIKTIGVQEHCVIVVR